MIGENRKSRLPRFDRNFLGSGDRFTQIGTGSLGGKAEGLVKIREILESRLDPAIAPGIEVPIPRMAVIGADFFGRISDAPLAVLEVECRSMGAPRCRFLLGNSDVLQYVFTEVEKGVAYDEAVATLV